MSTFGWWLPPGCPGARETEIQVRCVNPDCPEFGQIVGLAGISELGSVCLHDEDDIVCWQCGWERADDVDSFPIVTATGDRLVLVDVKAESGVLEAGRDERGFLCRRELEQACRGFKQAARAARAAERAALRPNA